VGVGTAGAETVAVSSVNTATNTITIVGQFANAHNIGDPVSLNAPQGPIAGTILANPGPQQRYNPRNNTAVVLHFSIVD
jgi:hypothetical protein